MTASLTWLADALRAEGCRVVEEGDWKHRGRSGSFEPYGVLWHHTGSTSSASNPFPTKDVLINGRPDLAGPLCHVGIGYDGVCHVIAAGRANHAGACNGFGPFSSSQDGNSQLVGFEVDYDGTQHMSAAQEDATTRCSAAVLKRFSRNEDYACRHEETSTTGKWDTGHISGDQLRGMIRDYLNGDDMPSAEEVAAEVWRYDQSGATPQAWAFQRDVATKTWGTDGIIQAPDRVTDAYWAAATYVHNMGEWVLQVRDYTQAGGPLQTQLAAIQAQLDEITGQLGETRQEGNTR
jgi:hypothetical protein